MNTLEKLDAILNYYKIIDEQMPEPPYLQYKNIDEINALIDKNDEAWFKLRSELTGGNVSKFDVLVDYLETEKYIYRIREIKEVKWLLAPKGAAFEGFINQKNRLLREEQQAKTAANVQLILTVILAFGSVGLLFFEILKWFYCE